MPPLLLILPLLLLVALLGLLVLRRRRGAGTTAGAAGSAGATGARETEEVRLLRLQVETLTEALNEVHTRNTAGADDAKAAAVAAAFGEPGAPALPGAEPAEVELAEAEPAEVELAEVEAPAAEAPAARDDALSGPLRDPLPELPSPPPADGIARAYADLSRSLAADGRVREAALTQWAADLRVLAPVLEGRGEELAEVLAALPPVDSAAAITRARTAAAALVGPSFAMSAQLADLTHLDPATAPASIGRPAEGRDDVSADVLPDHLIRALETALVASADAAGDTAGLSVGLRCDLVAHLGHDLSAGAAEDVVRDILEPHERARFDAALAGRAS